MKLKEFTDPIFLLNGSHPNITNCKSDITPEQLKLIKEHLQKCDEFENVTELIIMDSPFAITPNGPIHTNCMKIGKNMNFSGKLYLYSINQTPEIYDPMKQFSPVKDGCGITPTMYDPEHFIPFKQLILSYNLEKLQDNGIGYIHELIDKVFNNIEEYQIHGDRGVMIRCIAETVESEGQIYNRNVEGIVLETNPPTAFHKAYYMEYSSETTNDTTFETPFDFDNPDNSIQEVKIDLKFKYIPHDLANTFIEELGDKGISVTGDEIDEFLKKYKK